MSVATIYNRLNSGYAIDAKLSRGKVPEVHKVGKSYFTVKEISERVGRSPSCIYNRLHFFKMNKIAVTFGMF